MKFARLYSDLLQALTGRKFDSCEFSSEDTLNSALAVSQHGLMMMTMMTTTMMMMMAVMMMVVVMMAVMMMVVMMMAVRMMTMMSG